MGIFEQKHGQYGIKDSIGLMRDNKLALWALSKSDIVRWEHEIRAMQILGNNSEKWADLRNNLFATKDPVIAGHVPDTSWLKGADTTNDEYHRLIAIREQLMNNPNATLVALDISIHTTFQKFGISSNIIQTIEKRTDDVSVENFDSKFLSISNQLGHIGEVFFLEGCIAHWKCLEQISTLSLQCKMKHSYNKKNSFEYWDFHNVCRLAETKQQLSYVENTKNNKAFILSGGAGNTLASLWVMLAHLESGGNISMISGTSMGGALAAIVGSIGNDIDKITELMHDLEQGFEHEWKHYTITEKNLYIPWVPLLAKAFIEKIMIKYGVHKNTRFSDLKIPVVINAGRQYTKWEQEIVLGGWDMVHDSILASMNVPIPGFNNFGGLGRTKIDTVAMIDYAANERGNPTHWVESLGIPEENMIVVDAGYSSETWGETYGTWTRQRFLRATQRDFFAKLRISQRWGVVINIDPGLAWPGGWWKMNPMRTKNLYQLWSDWYNRVIVPKKQEKLIA